MDTLLYIKATTSIRETIQLENEFIGFMMRRRETFRDLRNGLSLYRLRLSDETNRVLDDEEYRVPYAKVIGVCIPELMIMSKIMGDTNRYKNLRNMLTRHIEYIEIKYEEDIDAMAFVLKAIDYLEDNVDKEVSPDLHEAIAKIFIKDNLLHISKDNIEKAIDKLVMYQINCGLTSHMDDIKIGMIISNIVAGLSKIVIMRS